MRKSQKIFAIGILFLSITSCKPKVVIEDDKGSKVEFDIESIELTSSEKEQEQDRLIIEEVERFIETNKSDVVLNYLFLCDTSMIEVNRKYDVNHKISNISIGIGKNDVRLSAVPDSYKIAEGPVATYKISNDSLGRFASYFLDLQLDENYKIKSFKGTLRFMKDKNGIEKLSFMKEINPQDKYLIEIKLKNNKW
ncbi:MAG: hypothetical protein GQ574_10475 [Crocinitomix sp.]|nr:hypothetical protein [Crocinitomix sp.]